jgi:hypothetical protein
MVRFILERQEVDNNAGTDWRDFYTMDIDVPALEHSLMRGGRGEMGFETHRLIGVEIIPDPSDVQAAARA